MQRYVLGFMFDEDLDTVLLIYKKKPEWQKDKYNGIGGKINDGESAMAAMKRELAEEAYVHIFESDNVGPECLSEFGVIRGDDYEVVLFSGIFGYWNFIRLDDVETDEGIATAMPVDNVFSNYSQCLDNVPFLVYAALNHASSMDPFKKLIVDYRNQKSAMHESMLDRMVHRMEKKSEQA